ncbi:MAG: hypothetical protein WC091_01470 [Sulfuricellaceae bacterium]
MKNHFNQAGSFILITVVFVMAIGGAMLYAMANMSNVSSASNTLVHNSNMALAAAQSGLKYCVWQLSRTDAGQGDCQSDPFTSDTSCKITITATVDGSGAPCWTDTSSSIICTIKSTAICPKNDLNNDPYYGKKTISMQIQKKTINGVPYTQMIPASRQVL